MRETSTGTGCFRFIVIDSPYKLPYLRFFTCFINYFSSGYGAFVRRQGRGDIIVADHMQ